MAAVGQALGVCEESAKSDDDTASDASEIPGYEGYSRKELSELVMCKMSDDTKEEKTVQWCIDNSYEEIKPGLWGSVVPRELPEAMKRYLQSMHAETSDGATTDNEDGMPIHPQNDRVAAWEALEALRYCKHILSSSRNQDQPWQHPQELLDASAGALDEAALALRTEDGSPDELEEVKILSDEIKESRRELVQAAAEGAEKSIGKGEKNARTLVVYATHTGTAKKFAKKLQKTLGDDVDVANMKDLTIASVAQRQRIFFICSTFGLGRPPRDAEVFFASMQLQEAPGRAPLAGVDVAVAALGNSGFGDFAAFGRVLAQELRLLGASHLMKVTTMDAKNGVSGQEKEFRAWQGIVSQLEGQNLTKSTKQSTPKVQETACCVIQ